MRQLLVQRCEPRALLSECRLPHPFLEGYPPRPDIHSKSIGKGPRRVALNCITRDYSHSFRAPAMDVELVESSWQGFMCQKQYRMALLLSMIMQESFVALWTASVIS